MLQSNNIWRGALAMYWKILPQSAHSKFLRAQWEFLYENVFLFQQTSSKVWRLKPMHVHVTPLNMQDLNIYWDSRTQKRLVAAKATYKEKKDNLKPCWNPKQGEAKHCPSWGSLSLSSSKCGFTIGRNFRKASSTGSRGRSNIARPFQLHGGDWRKQHTV